MFILDSTPGFNGLGKDDCKTRPETFKFWGLGSYTSGFTVRLMLHIDMSEFYELWYHKFIAR